MGRSVTLTCEDREGFIAQVMLKSEVHQTHTGMRKPFLEEKKTQRPGTWQKWECLQAFSMAEREKQGMKGQVIGHLAK